jgi:hypothetical protein
MGNWKDAGPTHTFFFNLLTAIGVSSLLLYTGVRKGHAKNKFQHATIIERMAATTFQNAITNIG